MVARKPKKQKSHGEDLMIDNYGILRIELQTNKKKSLDRGVVFSSLIRAQHN